MDSLLEELSKDGGQGQGAFGPSRSGNGPVPPTSGPREIQHWLLRCTPAENFARALNVVPEPLKALTVEAASRWEMRQEPILATLLHVLAGIAGTKHRLRRAHLGFSCPFSLVACGDERARHNWIEFLGEPWLGHLRSRIRMHQAFGPAHFIKELKSFEQQSSLLFGSILDKNKQVVRAQMTIAPCAIERSPLPGRLSESLKHSFGRTVVSLNGGIDPMLELQTSGRKQSVELCRLLDMSWKDMDLPTRGPVPRRGVVHLLWRTEVAIARQVVWAAQSPWRTAVPPVLLVREGSHPPYLSPIDAGVYAAWASLCKNLIDRVESGLETVVWSLSPEADTLVAYFYAGLAVDSPDLAPTSTQHFSWFYELVIRLAMLLTVLGTKANPTSGAEAVISLETMDSACSLGLWLAREHHECLKWLRHSQSVDSEDAMEDFDDIDNIDTNQLQEAILDRLATRGPLSKRDLSRSFHQMPARARDGAISRLKRRGMVSETDDGKVAFVAGSGTNAPIC